ncbi:MAG: di-heme oxidoredictase family protein [Pseudomonadota bacterium]|nr:di-heme oxidoredictase family protein [Pseudomonadota bacterium]
MQSTLFTTTCQIIIFVTFFASPALYLPSGSTSFAANPSKNNNDLNPSLSGGATTRFDKTRNAFSRPAKNLPFQLKRKFSEGNKLFRTIWVDKNKSNTSHIGLGPTYSAAACIHCHQGDGRSMPPKTNDHGSAGLVLRLANYKEGNTIYGEQIDTLAIDGVPAEAKVRIKYKYIDGQFGDGTVFTLRKPIIVIENSQFGPVPKQIHGRVAPAIIGLGLLAAIPEITILHWADQHDSDGDDISGRPNKVYDPTTSSTAIGRFGWKAGSSSLVHQTARALIMDIGITTSFFPINRCPLPQLACQKTSQTNGPETDLSIVKLLSFYSGALAVPARRNVNSKAVKQGSKLFVKAGCAKCHIPLTKTGVNTTRDFVFTQNQTIQPFTDLLLHDMGFGLTGKSSEGIANEREWRTAPLWGLGLIPKVNGDLRLLHDGRARNVSEAILWHGGESNVARSNFINMTAEERKLLIIFLHSL